MRLSDIVIDQYDDRRGELLREMCPNLDQVPALIKEAEFLEPPELETRPDEDFAVIALDGEARLRKYAMHDPGNVALSTTYLLHQARYLPSDFVKVAAGNLAGAHEDFGMSVPEELSKLAGFWTSPAKQMDNMLALQKATPEDWKQAFESPKVQKVLARHDGDTSHRAVNAALMKSLRKDMKSKSLVSSFVEKKDGEEEHEKLAFFGFGKKTPAPGCEHTKMGDGPCKKCKITKGFGGGGDGPEGMEQGSTIAKMAAEDTSLIKRAGLMDDTLEATNVPRQVGRYVSAGEIAPDMVPYTPKHTLVDGRFPVDTHAQIKQAEQYFQDFKSEMSPTLRHNFCVKLAERARDLALPVSKDVAAYSHTTRSPAMQGYVEARSTLVPEEFHPALEDIVKMAGEVSNEALLSAVEAFDRGAGIDSLWGHRLPDPALTVYGPVKTAGDTWHWSGYGLIVRADHLTHLINNWPHVVKKAFGHEFDEKFKKAPTKAFDSLSGQGKAALARIALEHDL